MNKGGSLIGIVVLIALSAIVVAFSRKPAGSDSMIVVPDSTKELPVDRIASDSPRSRKNKEASQSGGRSALETVARPEIVITANSSVDDVLDAFFYDMEVQSNEGDFYDEDLFSDETLGFNNFGSYDF